MNSMKLVIPIQFISWKTPNNAVTPQCQSQFTPKMKANAVPRLLSSLVWIDQYYNECNGMTSFMEFMIWLYFHLVEIATAFCLMDDGYHSLKSDSSVSQIHEYLTDNRLSAHQIDFLFCISRKTMLIAWWMQDTMHLLIYKQLLTCISLTTFLKSISFSPLFEW